MTKEFLKEQNISLENTWVCHDNKRNVRTVDIEQLLDDYYEWKVNKISSNRMLSDSLFAFNNQLSRYQDRLPSELKVQWNEMLEKANNDR